MSADSANQRVCVIRTGVANLASVSAGFERLGARAEVTSSAEDVRAADYVVLPGVGSFGVAMQELHAHGLVDVLRERIADDRPTLCVCLGMQLLGERSEESPGVEGLGIVATEAERFPASVRVPQLGWNRIEAGPDCQVLSDGYVYFANSYRVQNAPAPWSSAKSEHGGSFVAAIERGKVLACQFHPELSGAFGLELLRRWLERGMAPGESPC